MGRELTKQYASLFEKRVRNPFAFVHDIFQYGKLRELSSFIVWEFLHQLRLFPKKISSAFSVHSSLLDSR